MASSKCEICGQYYEEDDIRIIGYVGETCILQIYCRACHSQTLLAALIDESDQKTVPDDTVLTDLLETENEKFKNAVITINDVLDTHIYLSSFTGNISQLLKG